MRKHRFRFTATLATAVLALGTLAACGSSDNGGESTAGGDQSTPAAGSETTQSGSETESGGGSEGAAKDTEIVIGGIEGWWEGVAVGNLYKYVLEQNGYTNVTMKPLGAAGPTFQAVADGSIGLFFDTWLPTTHEDYWKQYKDKVVDVDTWYKKAPLTITVPSYMKINSIADLPSIGDKVDWTITGIDSSAGLFRLTKTKVIPEYHLDKYSMPASSGTAMLAALGKAIKQHKPIVVTLWHPHYAYGKWDLKDLKDPKNALGDPDSVHVIASKDLQESNPEVLDSLKGWTMSDKVLSSLGAFLQKDEYKNDMAAGVAAWAKKHPDVVKAMSKGL